MGTNGFWNQSLGVYEPIPPGEMGEQFHTLTPLGLGVEDDLKPFKIPQLRNLYEKTGMTYTEGLNKIGTGFLNDGHDVLYDFLDGFRGVESDQDIADLIALLMAFSGGDLEPVGDYADRETPPGPPSKDSHAAVGRQITFDAVTKDDAATIDRYDEMLAIADANAVGLVAKGLRNGERRGFYYLGDALFQADRLVETLTADELRTGADAGSEITLTVVPKGSEIRIGVDRDENGVFDGDEGSGCPIPGCELADINLDCHVDLVDLSTLLASFGQAGGREEGDLNGDALVDLADLSILLIAFGLDCAG